MIDDRTILDETTKIKKFGPARGFLALSKKVCVGTQQAKRPQAPHHLEDRISAKHGGLELRRLRRRHCVLQGQGPAWRGGGGPGEQRDKGRGRDARLPGDARARVRGLPRGRIAEPWRQCLLARRVPAHCKGERPENVPHARNDTFEHDVLCKPRFSHHHRDPFVQHRMGPTLAATTRL